MMMIDVQIDMIHIEFVSIPFSTSFYYSIYYLYNYYIIIFNNRTISTLKQIVFSLRIMPERETSKKNSGFSIVYSVVICFHKQCNTEFPETIWFIF